MVGLLSPDAVVVEAARSALPSCLSGADPGEILDLVLFVFPAFGERRVTPSTLAYWTRRPVRLAAALRKAREVVLGWPEAFHAALATLGLRSSAGYARTAAMLRDGPAAPGAVGRTFAAIVDDMRAGPGRSGCSASAYSVPAAARILKCAPDVVVEQRRTGTLRTMMMLRQSAIVPGLHKDDVDVAARASADRVGLFSASQMLDLPGYAVAELVRTEVLGIPRHPHLDERLARVQVRRSDVEALRSRLLSLPPADERRDLRSLEVTMHRIAGRPKPWAAVLAAILSGRMSAFVAASDGPLPSRLLLQRGDAAAAVRMTSGTDASDSAFSHVDAIDVLNVSPKIAGRLSALRHVPRAKGIGTTPLIPLSELVHVGRANVTERELFARWGIHKTRTRFEIAAMGVSSRRGPFGWPRSEVEAAFAGRPEA